VRFSRRRFIRGEERVFDTLLRKASFVASLARFTSVPVPGSMGMITSFGSGAVCRSDSWPEDDVEVEESDIAGG